MTDPSHSEPLETRVELHPFLVGPRPHHITILRESCEHEPSLGYELFKRMSAVMIERLQNARGAIVARARFKARVHAAGPVTPQTWPQYLRRSISKVRSGK